MDTMTPATFSKLQKRLGKSDHEMAAYFGCAVDVVRAIRLGAFPIPKHIALGLFCIVNSSAPDDGNGREVAA